MNDEHPSLYLKKEPVKDYSKEKEELWEQFQPILEAKRRIKESEEQIMGMFTQLMAKFDELKDMKKENLALEKSVLTKLDNQL